jgi:putative flippase GtrA
VNRKLVRSCAVGAAATLVDLGTLWLLVHVLGWPATAANVPALLVGVVAQFIGAKVFAFECRSPHLLRQGGQFALVEAGALALNAIVFHVLVTATPVAYPIARLVGSSLVYFAYSYPLWRRIFGPGDGQRQGG